MATLGMLVDSKLDTSRGLPGRKDPQPSEKSVSKPITSAITKMAVALSKKYRRSIEELKVAFYASKAFNDTKARKASITLKAPRVL